ncbi:MAG: HAD hydrolase family protein [Gammaproteobacteria bacterium]|nr:HAD hydrolase family protein [Gammaproteobacteria bacterium]
MDLRKLNAIARNIRLAVFDVDGVFTDGRLYYGAEGEMLKAFHVRDGVGIKSLHRAGITTAIITGRTSGMVAKRMTELGIDHVQQGREDKGDALGELCDRLGIELDAVAYTGDDTPDISAMEKAALAFTVHDAHPDVLRAANWRTTAKGGHGAVREICDLLIAARIAAKKED